MIEFDPEVNRHNNSAFFTIPKRSRLLHAWADLQSTTLALLHTDPNNPPFHNYTTPIVVSLISLDPELNDSQSLLVLPIIYFDPPIAYGYSSGFDESTGTIYVVGKLMGKDAWGYVSVNIRNRTVGKSVQIVDFDNSNRIHPSFIFYNGGKVYATMRPCEEIPRDPQLPPPRVSSYCQDTNGDYILIYSISVEDFVDIHFNESKYSPRSNLSNPIEHRVQCTLFSNINPVVWKKKPNDNLIVMCEEGLKLWSLPEFVYEGMICPGKPIATTQRMRISSLTLSPRDPTHLYSTMSEYSGSRTNKESCSLVTYLLVADLNTIKWQNSCPKWYQQWYVWVAVGGGLLFAVTIAMIVRAKLEDRTPFAFADRQSAPTLGRTPHYTPTPLYSSMKAGQGTAYHSMKDYPT